MNERISVEMAHLIKRIKQHCCLSNFVVRQRADFVNGPNLFILR